MPHHCFCTKSAFKFYKKFFVNRLSSEYYYSFLKKFPLLFEYLSIIPSKRKIPLEDLTYAMDYWMDPDDLAYMYELEKELEADVTIHQDGPLYSPQDHFKNRSLLNIIFAVFFGLSLPAIIVFCRGILLHVFALRATILLLSRLLEITSHVCMFLYTAHFLAIPPDVESDFIRSYTIDVFSVISLAFSLMEELLASIFMWELYLCVCQLQQRQHNMKLFLGKVSLTLLVAFLICGLDYGLALVVEPLERHATSRGLPFMTTMSFVNTGILFVYGVRVIKSLKKSQNFRRENSSGAPDKESILIISVTITVFMHALKQILRISFI